MFRIIEENKFLCLNYFFYILEICFDCSVLSINFVLHRAFRLQKKYLAELFRNMEFPRCVNWYRFLIGCSAFLNSKKRFLFSLLDLANS